MSETETIARINGMFPRHISQLNRCFEADAEILQTNDGTLHVNIDEFSSEDLLRDDDPYTLGWNLAVGGISDILASGAVPTYYGHAMVKSFAWDQSYLDDFCLGIADVLKQSDIAFIGGDFGQAEGWRYTAVVLGRADGAPVMRTGAAEGDSVYITGKIGRGNLNAGILLMRDHSDFQRLLASHENRFCLRLAEAALIRRFASCCIDTSDGVFNCLNAIAQINDLGYRIEQIPYLEEGVELAQLLGFPRINLFLGEAGEYELLFTVSRSREEELLREAQESGVRFYRLGSVSRENGNRRIVHDNGRTYDLTDLHLRARDYGSAAEYLAALNSRVG